MKKIMSMMLILTMSTVFMMGCSGGGNSQAPDTGQQERPVKVSLVTDVSGVNDQGFNQSSWEGMQRSAEDFNIEISYKESTQNADYIPNLNAMYDEKNDLIWGVGFGMSDAVLDAAKTNTDQKFAIVDAGNWDETPENLLGITFKTEDAGFLVGYIAANMTKTNRIGFIGGQSIPTLWQFECGYRAGAAYANPDVEMVIQYAESFTDVAKGKSIANGMFVQDVDIVFVAAGGLGDGVIEAARESGKWVIGCDRDQNYMAPENVLTSALKRVDNAIYNVNQDLVNGSFEGGKTVVYGLKEGAVGIAPTSSKNVPEDILEKEAEVERQLLDGELNAPGDYDALDAFLKDMN